MKTPLLIGLIVVVLFVSLVAWLAWRSAVQYRDDERMVTHTHQVLEELNSVLARIRDAESATRGYIATGNEAYLKPYHEQREEILRSHEPLLALVGDNPDQTARAARLAPLLQDRVDRFDTLIRIRKTQGLAEAAAGLTPGRLLSERVREVLAEMEKAEQVLLKVRLAESEATLGRTLVYFGVLGVVVVGILGSLFLTARHLETVRQRARAELDRFFTASLDLMGVADLTTGRFKTVSPSWGPTLGWTKEEVTSQAWLDLVHPEDRAPTIAAAQQLAEGKDLLTFENRYRHKDGSYRWLSWRVTAPAAGSTLAHCLARDITTQKEREETIRRLNETLKDKVEEALAVNRELESFSYSVSHDLRAPLRAVDGFARILIEDFAPTLGPEGLRLLRRVCDSSKQMGQLIDDLLQYSRLGRKEIETTRVDMDALVRDVVADVRKDRPESKAEVVIGGLPAVRGDRALLKQVWTNLISNAFKYSAKRPEGARVEIQAENGGPETVYHVRDNGVGFDMRYQDKLFGVFQRLHSAKEFEGTGVGLAIVQRVIQRHGGRVWAEGKPGEGASFHFSIPTPKEAS